MRSANKKCDELSLQSWGSRVYHQNELSTVHLKAYWIKCIYSKLVKTNGIYDRQLYHTLKHEENVNSHTKNHENFHREMVDVQCFQFFFPRNMRTMLNALSLSIYSVFVYTYTVLCTTITMYASNEECLTRILNCVKTNENVLCLI